MPVPKRKKSRTRRDQRKAHIKLSSPTLVVCPQCKEMAMPHRVCPHCGYYKGREVIRLKSK